MSDERGEEQAVADFAHFMRLKLRENSDKQHWSNDHNSELFGKLLDELSELYSAMTVGDNEEVILECADVANFAMMIADSIRRNNSGG